MSSFDIKDPDMPKYPTNPSSIVEGIQITLRRNGYLVAYEPNHTSCLVYIH